MRRVCLKDAHNSAMLGCIGESQSVPVFSFHAREGRESWLQRASVSYISVSGLEAGHERDNESSCLCHQFLESTCVIKHPTHSGALLYHI